MRLGNVAELNASAEIKKLVVGSELIASSLMRLAIKSSRLLLEISSAMLSAMFLQKSLRLNISPSQVQEVDNWQNIGEMKVNIISLH
jgi:hypothetical protein